jgi:hypothetical protein
MGEMLQATGFRLWALGSGLRAVPYLPYLPYPPYLSIRSRNALTVWLKASGCSTLAR